jgi:hypothetical protein
VRVNKERKKIKNTGEKKGEKNLALVPNLLAYVVPGG